MKKNLIAIEVQNINNRSLGRYSRKMCECVEITAKRRYLDGGYNLTVGMK